MSFLSAEAIMVRDALHKAGIETPMITAVRNNSTNEIAHHFSEIMKLLGLDLSDDSLQETPQRVARMYCDEIFFGLNYKNFPKITLIENKMAADDVITIKDVTVTSTCEHHFITIDGYASVAYIPAAQIIGLSKINRIVHFFCQRPQVQERLTQQILLALQTIIQTQNVAVFINASHFCVKARGACDTCSTTETLALGGDFKLKPHLRAEFLQRVKVKK